MSQFGETITYAPFGRTRRSVLATVVRDRPGEITGIDGSRAVSIQITLRNSATSIGDDGQGGISVEELSIGRDAVLIAARVGETATERRIVGIARQNGAMVTLDVQ